MEKILRLVKNSFKGRAWLRAKERSILGPELLLIILVILFGAKNLLAQPPCLLLDSFYDPNLEVTFRGKIIKVYLPPKGLASIEVEREGKAYTVFLSPRRFYLLLEPDLRVGTLVEVTGAKTFVRRYGIIFVVRHVKNLETERLYLFRSPVPPYRPVWQGCP